MESHAWESGGKMGGNEVSFRELTIESTQLDALVGLKANPLENDV
jgi:hypothetical protein